MLRSLVGSEMCIRDRIQQDLVKESDGTAMVLPSCDARNMHVTMNSWPVHSEEEVAHAISTVLEWGATTDLAALCAPLVELKAVSQFNQRVIFLGLKDDDGLERLYDSAHMALTLSLIHI
eukprot:TRINITY_DN16391_c0_g1_i3.p2 TRINITY_DN16391_c0_g1~~TRINITY_DN16391_c0_g1_i3.p2  ORF type:complete len:120 (+),score=48.27 TRINITY_DN16391_c0_g1_i3:153-512(+)